MSVTLTLTETGLSPGLIRHNGESQSDGINATATQVEETREAELVVFENTTQGLGLKICGGCSSDRKEECGIFVKRVLPGGLAEASGSIQNGDLLLQVNKQSMEGITYDRAVSMLRQASASNHVEMVVTRDEEARIQYAHYVSIHGSCQSPKNLNADANRNPNNAAGADIDFQRKMNAFLKDANLEDLNSSGEHNVKEGELNGHVSPTSSTASELANHLDEISFSPRNHTSSNKTGPESGQGMSVDGLDSLLSKKLSQDPGLRLHLDQLASAMVKLGFDFPSETQQDVKEKLSVDSDGMVRFEEFVQVAKAMFHKDLGALKGRITPRTNSDLLQNVGSPEINHSSVVKERDSLLAEVTALKQELQLHSQTSREKEEQLLFIRKQMQVVIEEGRSLKSKLHLAEQAQARAKQTEHDYEEVVAMLENEITQLRQQASKSDNTNMQKRLAVLVCQLKKAESGKKTYEVATEKLIQHIEHSLEVLSGVEKSPRGLEGAKVKATRKTALSALSAESREVIKTVRSLMESVLTRYYYIELPKFKGFYYSTIALPFGWEEAYTSDGVRYYINHMNQTTTWTHPVSSMERQSNSNPLSTGEDKTQIQPSSLGPPPPLAPPHSSQQQQLPPEKDENLPSTSSDTGVKSQTLPQDQQTTIPQAPPRSIAKKKKVPS